MVGSRLNVSSPDHPRQAIKVRSPKLKRAYEKHYKKWSACEACPLHKNARFHVIGSGRLPCEVVFVGEAPGAIEDSLGKPFIGPAGKILTKLIKELELRLKQTFTYTITNTVICKPFPDGAKIEAPTQPAIESCHPRLEEFLDLAKPKIVIALGKVAFEALGKNLKYKVATVWHPSYILRNGGETSYEFRKTVQDLTRIIEGVL